MAKDKSTAFAGALRVWESLLRRFPSSEWSAKALGEIVLYYSNLKDPKANTYRRQLVEQFPESPSTVAVIGAEADRLFADKKYADAAKAYAQIESSLDENRKRNLILSKTLIEAGSSPSKLLEAADTVFLSGGDEQKDILQTARDLYLEALKGQNRLSKDELARLKTRLGWAYYQGTPDWKDIDKAEALWREVIAQNPKDHEWAIESRWYLVYLLAGPKNMDKPGEWKNAVKMCEEIMDASPLEHFRREQAMFVRAWLYWAWKDYQTALPLYEEYGKAYPSSKKQPAIQNYIKQCREKIGM